MESAPRISLDNASEALGLGPIDEILNHEHSRLNRYIPPATATIEPVESKPAEQPTPEPPKPADKPSEEPAPSKPEDDETPGEDPKPAEPTKPVEEPAPVPEPPKAPEKIKVGDKEYTPHELEQLLAPKPAEEKPKEEPPAPKEPTPEEIAQREADYLQKVSTGLNMASVLSPEDVETLLIGGQEALPVVDKLVKQTVAHAVLQARKSIYEELNPVLGQLTQQVAPMVQQTEQLERFTTQQLFNTRHPEFGEAGQLDLAAQVAEEMSRRYPDQVRRMSREQFVDEVARQTDELVQADFQRWYPGTQGTWKDHVRSQKQAPTGAGATPPKTPPPPPVVPVAEPQPAVPKPAKPKPPVGASPGAAGKPPGDWQREVAQSLTS